VTLIYGKTLLFVKMHQNTKFDDSRPNRFQQLNVPIYKGP
jgi:hypothetical protein